MSSGGDRGSGIGERDRIDTAIDLAVREMLDVEPPPGLRGRVIDRLETPRRGIPWAWLAAPVAAAAIIVLAVIAPWRETTGPAPITPPGVAQTQPPPTTPTGVAQTQPPRSMPPVFAPQTAEPNRSSGRVAANDPLRPRVTAPRPDRLVAAAAVDAVEEVNFTAIDALAGPPAIAIERLGDPLPSSMRSIEPAPLQIRAIEITALPDTPRERREE